MNQSTIDPIRKYKTWLAIVSVLLVAVLCVQGIYMAGGFGKTGQGDAAQTTDDEGQDETFETAAGSDAAAKAGNAAAAATEEVPGSLFHEGYTLEQVVVFSRHNIRSPLTSNGNVATTVTPHQWIEWSTGSSKLSIRGGDMETHLGQYFRKWLEAEGLFPANYHPEEGEVRVFANSKQRTIATAQYFTAGLLPTANMAVEYHGEFGTMQPEFGLTVNFLTPEYEEAVREQVSEIYDRNRDTLAESYELLKDVLDFEESEAYRNGTMTEFGLDDMQITYAVGEEPKMTGTLKSACGVADALILQYYEDPDAQRAAFGKTLTEDQWKQISAVKDIYNDVIFGAPLLSGNIAHNTMQMVRSELAEEGRRFSFLCGHDSNILGILTCLGTADYDPPATVETSTPIGAKIVFSRWTDEAGGQLMSVDLVYATTAQLRDVTLLDLNTHPAVMPVVIEGLDQNADGLYKYEDVLQRFDEAISEYDRIVEEYGAEELDEAA